MIVSCILLKGAEFDERHVYWLGRQVAQHYPDATFLPYSDVPLAIPYRPLVTKLPRWWAKMDAAKDPVDQTTLMLDLDTVLIKPVQIPLDRPSIPRHPIIHSKLACGIMLWTPDFRAKLAEHFFKNPRRYMVESNGDDQRYFLNYWGDKVARMQDDLPLDSIADYKYTVGPWGLRPENAIVMFHGLPRPWQVTEDWIPPLEPECSVPAASSPTTASAS